MVSPAGSSNSFSNVAFSGPKDDVNALITSPDHKLQNASRFHKLSPRSVLAVIETIRCFTISALVYFAYHSCLLPTVLLASVVAIAYVLKDRVKQLDAKNLGNAEQKTNQVASRILKRSASISSQISNRTNFLSRADSIRSAAASLFFTPIIEESLQELTSEKIKETFLGSLGSIKSLSIAERYDLLSICYYYLLNAQNSMPNHLEKPWNTLIDTKVETKKYLADKYKSSFEQASERFQASVTVDAKGNQIPEINDAQKVLETAPVSLIMEIIQDLHQQVSQEQSKHRNKAEEKRHAINADHAGKYAQQLRAFEELQKMHFSEDLKSPR